MKNKKKRIIILVLLIIILFIGGIVVGGYLLKKDNENIEQRKQSETEELVENDGVIAKEKFNSSFNCGKIVGENELIYGYVDSVNGDIVKISDIYKLRGGRGFDCKEYTEGYVDLENVEMIEYYGTGDKIEKENLIGNIIFCKGKLVQKETNSYLDEETGNFLKVNNNKIETIDRMYFYNELNQIINEKQKINNIEIVGIDTEEKDIEGGGIYFKYISKINIDNKEIDVPCISCIRVTENTIFKNADERKYQIGKKMNVVFEDKIESIEVEHPKAKVIEYIDN